MCPLPRRRSVVEGRETCRASPSVGGACAVEHRQPASHVRAFKFPDFKSALAFVNRVGGVAEEQGHHPDILLGWGKVEITLWTHAVDGLTESDFILAAKIDQLS